MKPSSLLFLVASLCWCSKPENGQASPQSQDAGPPVSRDAFVPASAQVGSETPGPGVERVTLHHLARSGHTLGRWCVKGRIDRILTDATVPGSTWMGLLVTQVADLCHAGADMPAQMVIGGNVETNLITPYCTTAKDCRLAVGSGVILFVNPGEFQQTGQPAIGFWDGIPVFDAATAWILDSPDGQLVSLDTPRPHGDILLERATVTFDFLTRVITALANSTEADVQRRCENLGCPARGACLWGEACGTLEILGEPDPCLWCEPVSASQASITDGGGH